MRGFAAITLPAAVASLLSACGSAGQDEGGTRENDSGQVKDAPAVPMVNSSGQIIGEVRGGDSDDGATLLVQARGIPPGQHGIHIHEVGLCEPPDFKSAGGHWNPTGAQHGGQNPNGAHMGDLQNVTVGNDGTLRVQISVPGTYLRNQGRDTAAGARQILDGSGAAVVIHAQPDDYKTDPSGNSGDRIACAVLGSPAPGTEAMIDGDSSFTEAAGGDNRVAAAGNEASADGATAVGTAGSR